MTFFNQNNLECISNNLIKISSYLNFDLNLIKIKTNEFDFLNLSSLNKNKNLSHIEILFVNNQNPNEEDIFDSILFSFSIYKEKKSFILETEYIDLQTEYIFLEEIFNDLYYIIPLFIKKSGFENSETFESDFFNRKEFDEIHNSFINYINESDKNEDSDEINYYNSFPHTIPDIQLSWIYKDEDDEDLIEYIDFLDDKQPKNKPLCIAFKTKTNQFKNTFIDYEFGLVKKNNGYYFFAENELFIFNENLNEIINIIIKHINIKIYGRINSAHESLNSFETNI